MMNDLETNPFHIQDMRRGSVEMSPQEAPQKLNSYLLKLRQLVNKNSITSFQSTSPNQTIQQISNNHLSKQTHDGTLWETISPTASYLSDCSQLVTKKLRNNPSPKPNSTVNHKFSSKSSLGNFQPSLEDFKGKTSSKAKAKVAGLLSGLSSPKTGNIDLNATDLNCTRSTKENSFNPQKFINYLLSHPKTNKNQDKKAIKLHSCIQNDEDYDRNFSQNTRMESFASPSDPLKKTSSHFRSPMSQVNQSMGSFFNQENRENFNNEDSIENLTFSKAKPKNNQSSVDAKKNEKNTKTKNQQYGSSETLTKKNSVGNLGRKKNVQVDNEVSNEAERNRRNTIEKVGKKRHAVTPDELTTNREKELEIQIDNKVLRLTPKLFKASKDRFIGRKASTPVIKDNRLDSRKRSATRSKGQRLKSSSKRILKESPSKSIFEREGNGRRGNAPGNLMMRAFKGSSPNILSSSMSYLNGLSTKNLKKGDSQTFINNLTGDFEKSNEMTMSRTQDTTAYTKVGSKKDLTFDENSRDTIKIKKLMRAQSQGGAGQIEEALAELARNDKMTPIGARSNGKILSLKNPKDKRSVLASFKSSDEKDILKSSLLKDSSIVEQKKNDDPSEPKADQKVTMLCQVLERTNKVLSAYQEREKNWQLERKDLLEQLIKYQEKEKMK